MHKLPILVAAAATLLSACATRPEKVAAAYVSPVLYQNLSCEQLAAEAARVSGRVAQVTGQQDKQATGDAVKVGVALVLFWPAAFFVGGNDEQTAELSRLKGKSDAIQQAAIAGNCAMGTAAPVAAAAAPQKPRNAPVGRPG